MLPRQLRLEHAPKPTCERPRALGLGSSLAARGRAHRRRGAQGLLLQKELDVRRERGPR